MPCQIRIVLSENWAQLGARFIVLVVVQLHPKAVADEILRSVASVARYELAGVETFGGFSRTRLFSNVSPGVS